MKPPQQQKQSAGIDQTNNDNFSFLTNLFFNIALKRQKFRCKIAELALQASSKIARHLLSSNQTKSQQIPHLKIFAVSTLNISAFFSAIFGFFSAIKQSKTFDFVQVTVPEMFEFALGSRLKNMYAPPQKIENCSIFSERTCNSHF